jgi:hypothetical protein
VMATGMSGCSARRAIAPDAVICPTMWSPSIPKRSDWPSHRPVLGAIYRPAQPPHILDLTIVHYDYKPKRARNAKPPKNSRTAGSSAPNRPRKRHYGEIVQGVPDDGQRTELARQFFERTLKDTPPR